MNLINVLFFQCVFLTMNAQWVLPVELRFENKIVDLNQPFNTISGEVKLSQLRFYIMDVKVFSEGRIYKMVHLANLIDANKVNEIAMGGIQPNRIDSISFLFGTTKEVNEQIVLEGDLDPLNGMYWAWNSGYINFKMEGILVNNSLAKVIEYHLGGYDGKFSTAHTIVVHPNSKQVLMMIDIACFFEVLLSQDTTELMIPGIKAATLLSAIAYRMNK